MPLGFLMISAGVMLSVDCLAQRVQVPLTLDHRFIESLLREQVFTSESHSVRLNDDGSGCQYLELSQPRVSTRGGRVLLRTLAEARSGRVFGGRCMLLLDWRGQLELTQEPVVGEDRESILLRTSSWRTLGPDGGTAAVSTTIGHWLEQFLPFDLKQTRISFAAPINHLRDFLTLIVTPDAVSETSALLGSIAIDGVSAEGDRATVTLGMDVPPAGVPEKRTEPVLSPDELARLERRLDALDAFYTGTIKSLAREAESQDPAPLLDLLLELRRELIAVLGEPYARVVDPVGTLFVDAWDRLVPVLKVIAEEQPDHGRSLHYLAFISAGDALRALDRLGPGMGIEVSIDGLRRLARILIPDDPDDPLRRDDGVDPELRKSLGFGPPIPPPQVVDDASFNDPFWLDWLVPRALAADTLDPAAVRKLNNWVPKARDMNVYLPMVRDVLRHVVAEQLRAKELDGTFHKVYRWLVFAAAWQESCWRQFVAKNDKRVPMQSGTGDLGMMQINPKIWRGLYDLHGLRWDIVYNARAGADILEHHMLNYAIPKGEHQTTGAVDNLARSAYAAYNGGPRQYDRYRRGDTSARGRKIDALFYEKYLQIKSGKELAVASCF